MNGKEITEKLRELNTITELTCTDRELEELLGYGILLEIGGKYTTRLGKIIKVDVITTPNYKFNINLTGVISSCLDLSKKHNIKRIYCMSQKTYDKYKTQELIINKDNVDYYRYFEGELWLVNII